MQKAINIAFAIAIGLAVFAYFGRAADDQEREQQLYAKIADVTHMSDDPALRARDNYIWQAGLRAQRIYDVRQSGRPECGAGVVPAPDKTFLVH